MSKKFKLTILGMLVADAILGIWLLISRGTVDVLAPRGVIASKERSLIVAATFLMLLVVIPVYILTLAIVYRYRADKPKGKYMPERDHNRKIELLWWAIPCVIIFALAIMTWASSHSLDPFKPIASKNKPITIQVVALQWKWLFLYPDQNIASLNYVEFPENTPVNFVITADAPMNSFWIPQLGGQIYAMSGMSTQLHLMAGGVGSYDGSSANISGKGFAGMKFVARSVTQDDFNQWVQNVKHAYGPLTKDGYDELAKPSENNPATYYSSEDRNLYSDILAKYMAPSGAQNMEMH